MFERPIKVIRASCFVFVCLFLLRISNRNVQCAFLSHKRKTLAEVAGLPPKPKKPLTPYFRFMKELRPQLVAQNPDKHSNEVVRMIGKSWETVDPATKQKFEAEYKKEKEVFDKELVKYESSLTPQMKEDLKVARNDRVEKRARLVIKKRNKDLGKPKRAASAFLHFISAERKANPQTAQENTPAYVKRLGAKWATMSEAEKKPFVDAAAKALVQYKKDLEVWEARMVKEGNMDVIRNPIFTEELTAPKKATAATKSPPSPRKKGSE